MGGESRLRRRVQASGHLHHEVPQADERFIRMWEYYLALSEAGFATGVSQDLQVVFEKGHGLA